MTIENIDLDVVLKRTVKDNPELTAFELAQAELEYRNYWRLAQMYPGKAISPTKLADKVWHSHILFTKKYAQDCHNFLGYFLHHDPFDNNPSLTKQRRIKMQTKKLYEKHFGARPFALGRYGMCISPQQPIRKPTPATPRGPAPVHNSASSPMH